MSTQAIPRVDPYGQSFPPLIGVKGLAEHLKRCERALQAHIQEQRRQGNQAPAASCLLENHAFIRSEIRDVQNSLGASYIRKLPNAEGTSREPRIYRIAAEHASQIQGALTAEALDRVAAELRQGPSLKMCELWAFGSMLKLALLERLCSNLDSELQISICVKALRSLETCTWHDFVESVCAIEDTLRLDPAGIYSQMDFETRDRYRKEVEKLSEQAKRNEREVAEAALAAAQAASLENSSNDISAHVGYHLIGPGATAFARSLKCRPSLESLILRWPTTLYFGGLLIVSALVMLGFYFFTAPLPFWILLLLLIPASQAALEIVNLLVCNWVRPRQLPGLDFSSAIPDSCRSMVVVPALLTSREVAAKLVEDLEIRYLANRDPNLLFALLTDFPDSDHPGNQPESVLEYCKERINQLNAQYGGDQPEPFYLFHRPLLWNASESKWMGYERKRGKLNDLNQLLLGKKNAFDTILGDRTRLARTRYVLTLDADTQLPRETAAKMIGAMAHPLNQPVLDPSNGTVIRGYGLIRPRVSVTMQSAERSLFSKIFSGMAGFDPYATSVSDVYQDLFGLSSFTGKGIYDVRAFDSAAGERFPENAILSHDLVEGEFVRTGFYPSVEVVEDYPATYQAFCKRKHRWARGDWQLLPWLLAPSWKSIGTAAKNKIPVLGRWKMFDNLRSSLVEIATIALLAAGWASLRHPLRWLLAVLAVIALPIYVDALLSMGRTPLRSMWKVFAHDLGGKLVRRHRDALINFVFLPHQALLMADAVARTLVRRFLTRRNLLEWETMAQSQSAGSRKLGMIDVYLYASGLIALVCLFAFDMHIVVSLVCAFWATAPLVALWMNQSPREPVGLSDADRGFLRETALRTWRYFADHSTSEQNWLIPDNVQHQPPSVANRISPTNLGMLLTAKLAAHDFGYSTLDELAASLRRTFDSMANLGRYRGHFYNWYDTTTLLPVGQRYVSSVDSGNLAASLCSLRQGLLALGKQPVFGSHTLAGLRDHVLLLRDLLPADLRSASLMRLMDSLLRQLSSEPPDLFFWEAVLRESSELVARIWESVAHTCERLRNGNEPLAEELAYWNDLLAERVRADLAEIYTLAPWLTADFESELRLVHNARLAPLLKELSSVPTVAGLPAQHQRIREGLAEWLAGGDALYPALRSVFWRLLVRLTEAEASAVSLVERLDGISAAAAQYFDDMDFSFLYHDARKLLRIGIDTTSGKPDEACYDLLASEARTAVFLAVAKGHIPRESWFKLARKITAYGTHRTLLSWSGTMFEYLMPLLHLRAHPNTLLREAARGAVRVQQAYARAHNLPWGISESAYAVYNANMHYHYRAFGVPALSASPDRSDAFVIAPYASMLALPIDPARATANLRWLSSLGCLNRHGFFEALDYAHAGAGQAQVVRCYMAHHQGMGLLAINNVLLGDRMQERFHSDPMVQATEFLLEERMPIVLDIAPEIQSQAIA